ncbi:glycine cleavage T-protein barrel domain protein [Ostertagia ostertagi]
MNMMRLEHGYKIWGRELTLDTNPFECGLGALVDFSKEDFIGKAAALELSKQKFDRRLALLTFDPADNAQVPLEWKSLPFGMEVVRREGHEERIGQITSGSYSVRLRRPIAFAWIDSDIQPNERDFNATFKMKFPKWQPYEPRKRRTVKRTIRETVKELVFDNPLDYLHYIMKIKGLPSSTFLNGEVFYLFPWLLGLFQNHESLHQFVIH